MRLQKYYELNEMVIDRFFMDEIKKLKNLSWSQVKKKFLSAWEQLKETLKTNEEVQDAALKIINKYMKTNYNDLDDVRLVVQESEELNEDASHWWQLIKGEAFPALSFYPALQCWLELDKLLKGTGFNATILVVYASFWLLLVSSKYIKGWLDWRKTKPDEYGAEKALGKGGLV
jgi:hypothetical protein